MDIVIISEFCGDFTFTDNDRFLYLARMLAATDNNQVEIITSSFRHETKKHRRQSAVEWPFKITFIEEPGYPRNICLKRFYSHHIWGKNITAYLNTRKNPDVIYCAIPSLTGPNLVAKYCKKKHVRFIIDVQDLWPEAFMMVFNIPLISKLIFAPFTALANGAYKRADAICAVSDTYCQRALKVNHKVKTTTTVFLGTDLETFDHYAAECPIMKKDINEIWIAYCGTLGSSYDLTCVFDALAIIDDPRICFIIMGDGPKQNEFESYAKQKGVKCVFTGRIPYNEMCCLLNICDITINPIAHNAAQSIINKHADYAASGLPIISTQENEEYRQLVDLYQMGYNCRNNDAEDVAEKLQLIVSSQELRIQMGINARQCALEKFDRKSSYKKLEQIIEGEQTDAEGFKL